MDTPRREARNRHRGKFIVFLGERNAETRELARHLEARLHADGMNSYYLALTNVLGVLSDRSSRQVMEREEQLQRLGELARVMTDAGLLFITTLPEADAHDLEKLRLLNAPFELFVVTVGDTPLPPETAQVSLPDHVGKDEAIGTLLGALSDQGIVLTYEI